MSDVAGRIEELEVKAAESALIADLTTDWEVRTYKPGLPRSCGRQPNCCGSASRSSEAKASFSEEVQFI